MIWGTRSFTRDGKRITEWQWFEGNKVGKGWTAYKGSSVVDTTSHGVINLNSNGTITRLGVPGTGKMSKTDEKNNEDWMVIKNATGGLMCSASMGLGCLGDKNSSEFQNAKGGADAVQYAFLVKTLIKAGLSLAAIAAIVKSNPDDVASVAISVTKNFKNLECTQCATALKEAFKAKGISGEALTIDVGYKYNIWSNSANGVISTNGVHQAVKVGDMVFDNIHKTGIPYKQWLDDFASSAPGSGIGAPTTIPF